MKRDKIHQFLNARKPKSMFSAQKTDSDLQIYLYGVIGDDLWGYGISAKQVADQIAAAGSITGIDVRINSPGGDAFEGAAICNVLNSAGVPVDVIVDGLAASAASYIAMVGKTVTMGEGAMLMIHNPWSIEMGDANDMRKMADILDKVRDSMLSGYMKRYNGTEAELKAMLDEETWLTAKDCMDMGFCDQIGSEDPETYAKAKKLAASFDFSVFKRTPAALRNKKKASDDCECPCSECGDGNCENCSHEDCNCVGCDCPQHVDAATQATIMDIYRRRLSLYERRAKR